MAKSTILLINRDLEVGKQVAQMVYCAVRNKGPQILITLIAYTAQLLRVPPIEKKVEFIVTLWNLRDNVSHLNRRRLACSQCSLGAQLW